MGRHLQALRQALRFLTVLSVPGAAAPAPPGLALLWYPAVGLLLGALLLLAAPLLPGPGYLQGLLLLVLWVALTGALHLDGLADCADAWLGGLGDAEKTLRLLKDPLCGSAAVVALVLVLAVKGTALIALVEAGRLAQLWAVPLLARLLLLPLFATTPYVRAGGSGSELAANLPPALPWVVAACALALLLVLPLQQAVLLLLVAAAVLWLVRAAAMRRLGGFTGDVAGALVELAETALLLVLVAV